MATFGRVREGMGAEQPFAPYGIVKPVVVYPALIPNQILISNSARKRGKCAQHVKNTYNIEYILGGSQHEATRGVF